MKGRGKERSEYMIRFLRAVYGSSSTLVEVARARGYCAQYAISSQEGYGSE
jgi:hypothetical protein